VRIVARGPAYGDAAYWAASLVLPLVRLFARIAPSEAALTERDAPAVVLWGPAGREHILLRTRSTRTAIRAAGRFERELDRLGLDAFCAAYGLRPDDWREPGR